MASCIQAVLIILLHVTFIESDDFDITTIYKFQKDARDLAQDLTLTAKRNYSVEIRARNAAIGLPYISPHGKIINKNVDLESCTASREDSDCRWSSNKFTDITDTPPLVIEKGFTDSLIDGELSKVLKFKEPFSITVYPESTSGTINLFLMETSRLDDAWMYHIQLCNRQHNYYEYSYVWKCAGSGSVMSVTSTIDRLCYQLTYKSVEIEYWNIQPYVFTIDIVDDKYQLSVKSNTYSSILFTLPDDSPLNIQYLTIGVTKMDAEMTLDNQLSFALDGEDGSMMSPFFVPRYNKVCVSVVYYPAVGSSIKAQVIKSNGEIVDLSHNKTNNLVNYWQSQIFSRDLGTDKPGLVRIKISAASPHSHHLSNSLKIQRVGGCTSEDEDVTYVESSSENVTHVESSSEDGGNMGFYAYDVPLAANTVSSDSELLKLDCMNGGVYHKERRSCVCPTGFMGSTCETGCGADTYSSKCDKRCSRTKKGCMEMKFCQPKLGCSCAAGIKGNFCDIPCSPGEYGASCAHSCGHCSSGFCDIYTGLCPTHCEDGFYPPLCQEYYKHLIVAPKVEAIDLYTLQVTSNISENSWLGEGHPKFYQLQIKDGESIWFWKELEPLLLPRDEKIIEQNITNLTPNVEYEIRAVLLDTDGNSYQDEDIPTATSFTKCVVPDDINYNLSLVTVKEDEFRVQWQYIKDFTWCKVTHFEVEIKKEWEWETYAKETRKTCVFTDLLPGEPYEVRVRGMTIKGPMEFSKPLTVITMDAAPDSVLDLKVVSTSYDQLEVNWKLPFVPRGIIQSYVVSYKCLRLLACKQGDCSNSAGEVEVITPSLTIRGLLPHTQYSISVCAKTAVCGTNTTITTTTAMTVPEVSPSASALPIITSSNTSFTAQWNSPENCTLLNGYIRGYMYELYQPNQQTPMREGETVNMFVMFTGLTPLAKYSLKVYVINLHGTNARYPLTINAVTRATVPGQVEQLTVYKTGRRVLGLRWALPTEMYGDIRSFTVSYRTKGQQATTVVIKPTSCTAWSHLFCYTINSLHSDTEYFITVQARNKEVAEDGEITEISAVTKESAPLSPSYIKTISQRENNVTIEWGLPNMLNGVLRSFLVNVEETDSYNISECCNYFPIKEVSVRYEQASYQIQLHDLQPASTYAVSVTAKTVSLGPAVSIILHTRPPVPPMDGMLQLVEDTLDNPTLMIHPTTERKDLVSGYLVLVIPISPEINVEETLFQDDWISQELNLKINRTFYVAGEFTQANLEEQPEIILGSESGFKNGKWSEITDPILESGKQFRIGLVMVLDYCGVTNIGYTQTEIFTVQ